MLNKLDCSEFVKLSAVSSYVPQFSVRYEISNITEVDSNNLIYSKTSILGKGKRPGKSRDTVNRGTR